MDQSKASLTQMGNVAAFTGLLALILQYTGHVVPQEELAFVVLAIWTLGGQALSYYGRWRRGDLTIGGFRK